MSLRVKGVGLKHFDGIGHVLRNSFAAFISSATRRHGCGASVSGGEKRMFSKSKKIALTGRSYIYA